MKKHTRSRILSDFPCLMHVGLSPEQLEKADITVSRVDDALKIKRASCVQEGDGVHTDLRFNETRFHGFMEADPRIENEEAVGSVELTSATFVPFAESKETVADLLHRSGSLAVIVEVNEKLHEFGDPKISIIVHRV